MRPAQGVLKSCGSAFLLFLVLSFPIARTARAEPAIPFDPSVHPWTERTEPSELAAPAHESHDALLAAREHYREIVATGGWRPVPDGPTLEPGEPADPVRLSTLAERLAAEGDLSAPITFDFDRPRASTDALGVSQGAGPTTEPVAIYDATLSEAVRRFQERHGLEIDGKVGPNTLAALNVPAEGRLDQIELNLERWTEVPAELPPRRIEINVASAELKTYEDGRPVGAMKVVVGKPSSPTPTFRDRVTHVVLRPYWNVPAGIAGRELAPQARRNPGSLAARGFEVQAGGHWISPTAVDWSTGSHRIRQRPGAGNSLGLVKFVLAGQTLIYLHDTPQDSAFSRADRALSHGCVRLERPLDLAEWVLAGEKDWTADRIRSAATRGGESWVNLDQEVPVYVRYFTAWADDLGRVQFRDDVYGEDPAVLARMEQRARETERTASLTEPR